MQNNLLPVVYDPHILTVCPHPFLMEKISRTVPFGMSLQEVIDSVKELPENHIMVVQVDGTPVQPEIWPCYYPPEGAYISIRVLPMGGGDDGKMPLRILMSIAVIVASIYTYGTSLKALGPIWAAAVASAVSMAGSLLINALCPPAQSRLTERAGVNLEGVVNSITNARNQANPYGPIPVLLGRHRMVPFYAARPYTEISGNDQFLRLLFVPGYMPMTLSEFKVGETDLEDFDGVQTEVRCFDDVDLDEDITLYTSTVNELAVNIELLEASGWTQRTTQADTDEIVVDLVCPKGLCVFDSNGNRTRRSVTYAIEYRVKDSGDSWVGTYENTLVTEGTKGPFVTPPNVDRICRVIINLTTKIRSVIWGGQGYCDSTLGRLSDPTPPQVPSNCCSLAKISIPLCTIVDGLCDGNAVIANAQITDERADDARLVLDNPATDLKVTEEAPQSTYVTVAEGTFSYQPEIQGQSNETVRKAHSFSVPNGQYDVRIKRVTADSVDDHVYDDLYWSILRSITKELPVTADDVALVAMRIKASDQLNNVIDTFNCIGTSICLDWDVTAVAWVKRATSNPASLYRYVLQHPANKRAVADAKIDLTKLIEWHAFCKKNTASVDIDSAVEEIGGKVGIPCTGQPFETNNTIYISGSAAYDGRYSVDAASTVDKVIITATYAVEAFDGSELITTIGLEFNSLIDYQSSVSDVLQQIAAAGKAAPTYIDGKYSVVIDQAQTTPIQHFTPRNSWSFSGSISYPRIPHALRIIFANRLTNWEVDERVVFADGYAAEAGGGDLAATLYEQLELPGVTDPDQAYALARYHLAVLTLRPEKYFFYADVENLVSTRGDLIRVTHDVPLWGIATGRVKSVTDDGTDATAVVMDSIMTMVLGKTYAIRFRLSDGATLLAPVVLNAGEQTTLVFTTPILIADAPVAGDLGLFGETDSESVELLILSIEPGDDLTAKLTCVDYSPAVYTAASGVIGEHDSNITLPYSDVGRSGIPVIYNIRSDESVMYRDTDGSLRPKMVITLQSVGGYISQISSLEINWKIYDTDESWKIKGIHWRGTEEISILDVEEGVEYTLRARFNLRDGGVTQWSAEEQHTIVGKTTAPDVSSAITANPVIAGVRIEWTNPEVADFQYTGIWRAEADVFPGGDANYVVPGKPGETLSFVDRDVAYTVTYYYWLKSYDTAGNASAESASVNDNPYYVKEADIFDTIQSENYVADTSGWFIGFRGVNDGYAEFNDVTVRGTLIAGEIHIPDLVTADSFHVATDGDTWWGCDQADFNSAVANANAYVLKDGTVKFAGGVIAGFTIDGTDGFYSGADATRVQMKSGAGFWAGATAIGDAPFNVTNAGVLTAEAGIIGGFTISAVEGLYAGADATRVQMKVGVGFWSGATVFGSAPFRVSEAGVLVATSASITGAITATSGDIGGWAVAGGYLYSLQSGTPSSAPSDGIVLASANEGIIIYEDTAKRLELGYLSAGVYGIKGYDSGGSNVLFELSDTQSMIAGWVVSQTTLANHAYIVLDADNKSISINNPTFGSTGIQLEYNAGTPRAYIGDGSNAFFQFDGTKLQWKGANTELDGSGNLTCTGGVIGGFTLNASHLYTGSKTAYDDANAGVHLGTDGIGFGNNVFTVSAAGALVATSATITGSITSTSGTIGGFTLGATTLTATNLLLDAGNQKIILGTGDDVVSLDAADATYRLAIGDAVYADSPFRVTKAGVLTATSGTIGGCVLAASSIGSTAFVSGEKGWRIDNDGKAEFLNAHIRGVLSTVVFQKEVISCINGPLLVSSSDVLDTAMTAADVSTVTITGDTTFFDDEVIQMKDGVDDESMLVTDDSGAPTYVVTRDIAGDYAADTNPAWQKGTAVVSKGRGGAAVKTGYIMLDSYSAYGPFIDIIKRTGTGVLDFTNHARLGWLKGITDADTGLSATDVWGLWSDSVYLKGVIVADTGYIGGTSGWVIAAGKITSTGIGVATATGDATYAFWAGHDTPASAEFSVSHAGALVATSATITGEINASSGSIAGPLIMGNAGSIYTTGKATYASTTAGFFLGYDSGYQFNIGDANSYLKWSGAELLIKGDIDVASIYTPVWDYFLKGAWGFNDGVGSQVLDASGHENHGTLSGTYEWKLLEGVHGSGMLFDYNALALVIDDTSLNTNSLSFSAWYLPYAHCWLAYTDGDAEPDVGDTITGAESGATATFVRATVTTGAWVDGDAAGIMYFKQQTGTFCTTIPANPEVLNNTTKAENSFSAIITNSYGGALVHKQTTRTDRFWRSILDKAGRIYFQGYKTIYSFIDGGPGTIAVGDVVEDETTGISGTIKVIDKTGGAWGDGDASGTLEVHSADGAFTNTNKLKETSPAEVADICTLSSAATYVQLFSINSDTCDLPSRAQHIVCTYNYDTKLACLYVDAILIDSDTSDEADIGGSTDKSIRLIDNIYGAVDEIRYFDKELTENEVRSLYTNPAQNGTGVISANLMRTGKLISSDANTYFDLTEKHIVMNAKTSYNSATAGVFLGYDTDAYKFGIGTDANYLWWDGTKIQWKGANSELDASGNLICTGATLGGFTLNATSLIMGATSALYTTGKTTYADTDAGFWLGYDTDAYKFNIGDAHSYFKWDGATLTLNVKANIGTGDGIIYKDGKRWLYDFNPAYNGTVQPNGLNNFFGIESGNLTIGSTATLVVEGSYNLGVGYRALYSLTKGSFNIGLGYESLYDNTTGYNNIGIGYQPLYNNTTGYDNICIGITSLTSNTSGYNNICIGTLSLIGNTDGYNNFAIGYSALYLNNGGTYNIGIGSYSLYSNTESHNNIALGHNAGQLITGEHNIVIGYKAGDNITSGSDNLIIGYDINADSATADDQLNIGGVIKGNLSTGDIGIPTAVPLAKLHIDQSATDGAKPVITVDQADISEEFIKFIGSAASGVLTQSIVDEGDQGSATLAGWLKIYVEDVGNQVIDGAYHIPFYTLSA